MLAGSLANCPLRSRRPSQQQAIRCSPWLFILRKTHSALLNENNCINTNTHAHIRTRIRVRHIDGKFSMVECGPIFTLESLAIRMVWIARNVSGDAMQYALGIDVMWIFNSHLRYKCSKSSGIDDRSFRRSNAVILSQLLSYLTWASRADQSVPLAVLR